MCVEDGYANTIAIVFPAVTPSDKYNLPLDKTIRAHITVSVLGEIGAVDFSKEELATVLRGVAWEEVQEADVTRFSLFGILSDFLVMEVNSSALQSNWKQVNKTLNLAGITSLDKYPDYRPHVTLKHGHKGSLPILDALPDTVKVGSPVLWWGTETIPLT